MQRDTETKVERKTLISFKPFSDLSLFTQQLLLAFIILKLCGVIAWSWWWVLCPIWGGFVIWAVLAVILLLIQLLIR